MGKEAVILLVEDSSDDVALVLRTFEKGSVPNPVKVLHHAAEAKAYLAGEGPYADRVAHPFPRLLLLDLTLPGMDGFELLRWIRQEFRPRELRVVVLTGSVHLEDARKAYEMGADSFLMKPLEFQNAVEIGKCLRESWLEEPKPQGPGTGADSGHDTSLGELAA